MAEVERRSTKAFFGFDDEQLDAAPEPVPPPGDGWRMEGSGVCWCARDGAFMFMVVWHWVREFTWKCAQCTSLAKRKGRCLGCGAPAEERRKT